MTKEKSIFDELVNDIYGLALIKPYLSTCKDRLNYFKQKDEFHEKFNKNYSNLTCKERVYIYDLLSEKRIS